MKREEKRQIIEGLVEKFSTFDCFYVIDAMGLTVEQVNLFRKRCAALHIDYQVAKNTFIQKALEQLGKSDPYAHFFSEVLKGFSGILFVQEHGSAPAKLLKEFATTEHLPLPILKGASIHEELFIGLEHLEMLSNLKSKEEILGDIISLLKSPLSNVITSLQSGGKRLMGVVETLSKVPA